MTAGDLREGRILSISGISTPPAIPLRIPQSHRDAGYHPGHPAAPDLRAASDTGTDTDNITSDNAAWFDGYAEPGAAFSCLSA